jgi:hypothetical protein
MDWALDREFRLAEKRSLPAPDGYSAILNDYFSGWPPWMLLFL